MNMEVTSSTTDQFVLNDVREVTIEAVDWMDFSQQNILITIIIIVF